MSSSVGRNSLIMATGTAASRVTGQLRTILLAAAIGTTGLAANAYQAGSMIPQSVFTLVSGGIFNAVLVLVLSIPCALGFNVLSGVTIPAIGDIQSIEDFIVSNNMLPLGSLVLALFCCNRFGWGWDNFVAEANTGKGLKVRPWMKPIFCYFVPAAILFIYLYGMFTFTWR